MAFSHTHVPLFYDPKFANSSARKTIFADTTMELDDTVNRIWQAVKDAGLEEETLILDARMGPHRRRPYPLTHTWVPTGGDPILC
jgi:hypothetical protein